MLTTYSAILRDGRLEWVGGDPPPLPLTAARVHVIMLDAPQAVSRGHDMATALTALASAGGPSGFNDDPAEWQRQVRADRPLPGRLP